MKKLFLIAAFLFAFIADSKATLITNNTNCDVDVWIVCYDYICAGGACCISSETRYTVRRNSSMTVSDCASGCTTYLVRWATSPCNSVPAAAVANSICSGCWSYPPQTTLQGCTCPTALVSANIPGQLTIN